MKMSPKMYYLIQAGVVLYIIFVWIQYGIWNALIIAGGYLLFHGINHIIYLQIKEELDAQFDRRYNEKFMELRRDYSHLPHDEFVQLMETAVDEINKEVYG